MTAGKVALWMARRWYIVIIAALVLRIWWGDRSAAGREADLRAQLGRVSGGVERVGRDSSIVVAHAAEVGSPNLVERILHTGDYDRYEREVWDRVSEDLKRAVKARGETPAEVTETLFELPGEITTFQVGDTLDRPGFSLEIPRPEYYRLTLKPHDLRLAVMETREGRGYAEVDDLTLGSRLRINDLVIRRVEPRWQRHWLQVGFAAGYSATEDARGINVSASVAALALHKGTRTVQFGRFEADRHRVNVDVLRVTL